MSLWIKICGNTSLEDAQVAAEAGADAVGFVFAPSPRRVTPAQVAAITPHLPATLEKIGIFVDASFEEIKSTVRAAGLTGVQLHFDAPQNLPAKLRTHFGPELRILGVIHFDPRQVNQIQATGELQTVSGHDFSHAANAAKSIGDLSPEAGFREPNVDAILVDSRTGSTVGGTGQPFDWSLAAETFFQNTDARKLVAAGGLTPDNVAEAIAILRPWGVDVVSGVEAAPGRKDPAKVRAFIVNAKTAHRKKRS